MDHSQPNTLISEDKGSADIIRAGRAHDNVCSGNPNRAGIISWFSAAVGQRQIASISQDTYNSLLLADPNPEGGNYNFCNIVTINGQSVNVADFSCFMSRCGTLDSLDYSHGDKTFHIDTANPWFFPIGTAEHTIVDLFGGNTWWRGGIPRNP